MAGAAPSHAKHPSAPSHRVVKAEEHALESAIHTEEHVLAGAAAPHTGLAAPVQDEVGKAIGALFEAQRLEFEALQHAASHGHPAP